MNEVDREMGVKADGADWREAYAHTLGAQAYIFGFPWVYLSQVRYAWVTQPRNPARVPYAALNHFWHARTLANAEYRDGGSPNNDTLYSIAWLDLRGGPVVLSHPDMGDRYFTFEIGDMSSDNFAYVGRRTTGAKPGSFAIFQEGWNGTIPKGITALDPSSSPYALITGRTLVTGEADVSNVNRLQEQYALTPLALWGKSGAQLPENRDVWPPFDRQADPLADWKTMNKAMKENPPSRRHDQLLKLFGTIGVGSGIDIDTLDEPTKRGLRRAAADGLVLLEASIAQGARMKSVNGWKYPPSNMGRAGVDDDFVTRGGVQCLGGIISNDPAEAVYLNTSTDGDGAPLDGTRRYVLRFPKGEQPKVNAFWSLTMYDTTHNLVANRLDRYSIGDRTPGLRIDTDGGLTLEIQRDSDTGNESNWLPAPEGPFNLVLRCYLPAAEIIEQRWSPPALRRVG